MPSHPTLRSAFATMVAGSLMIASATAATSDRWNVPIVVKKLDNGLTVVVSEDHSSPTVGIAVVYKVGIRTEPRGRTGFAHLFEHLMFEGTPDAPQGVFDRVTADGGGDNNGSTHPDFTSYIERAPVSALEPLLWLEADRMKTLAFDQESLDGQRDVVKEEIRVNVLNQPYGGFSETDLPLLAFSKWENGHDGYGSFDDLDKARLDDVRAFHRDFYGPNNAVLGIAGDVTPEQGFALAGKYFGAIPTRATPPHPDADEPLNTAEKRLLEGDGLAKLPALAVGWKMPPRGSQDQAAMIVLGELLAGGGDASRLYQAMVKGSALAVQVGDFTGSGSPWEYDGPTLYTIVVIHKVQAKSDDVLAAIDTELARIAKEGVDPQTLQGVKTRLLADWYDDLEPFMDRAEHLAILQALWGDAAIANRVPDLVDGVTAADLQRVAAVYLVRGNRSIVERVPDFMLPPGSPARSELRAKAKAKPAKPAGSVSIGAPQLVKPATTPVPQAVPASVKPSTGPANPPPTPSPDTKHPSAPANLPDQPSVIPASSKPQATNATPAGQGVPTSEKTSAAATASASAPVAAKPTVASGPIGHGQRATETPGLIPIPVVSAGKARAEPDVTKAKPESVKPESIKPDIAKPESATGETAKAEAAKAEAAKAEAAKAEAAKAEAAKAEAAKAEAAKAEAAKAEAAKAAESARPDAAPSGSASPASMASDAASGSP